MAWVDSFRKAVKEVSTALEAGRRLSLRATVSGALNTNTLKAFGSGASDVATFSAAGGMAALINSLKFYRDDSRVVRAAAAALEVYVGGGTENQKEILNSSAIPNLVGTLSENLGADAALAVVKLLYIYTPTSTAVERMHASNIVENLSKVINKRTSQTELLITSMKVLTNVCIGNSAAKLSCKKHGGLAAVVKAMDANPTDLALNESAALFLRTVASDCEEAQNEIAQQGLASLAGILKNFTTSRGAVHQTCNALTNVTSTNLRNRDLLMSNDGTVAVVSVLREWVGDKEIAANALSLIRNMVAGNQESARHLCDPSDEVIELVCRAMMTNEESHEVQLRGCQVLRYACFAEENRTRVDKAKGISAIAGALRYANDFKASGADFYVNAILALANACFNKSENKNNAGKSGALSEAIKLLFNHRDLLDVQEAGLRLLRCLTEDNEFNSRLAASEKALSLCTMDLVGHADSPDICENGLALLLNLCYCREMLERMLNGDVENIVVNTLKEKHPTNRVVQIQGQRILLVLQTEPEEVTDNPSMIANRYEDYIDEVVLPTRSSGSLRRAFCG